jgi:homoserine dehydrogenase
MSKKVKVGLIGFGTVGSGVAKILLDQRAEIREKTGIDIELASVVDLDTTTPRPVILPEGLLTDDLNSILEDDSIDIAVELVGGTTFAKDLQSDMLKKGKSVVTANKALLAKHGIELYKIARDNGKCIAFEASCAGGIPVVSALRSGLAANRIEKIYGILNGTCNYILTSMAKSGADFPDALKDAQKLGYAEADPTLDINGGDSGHKLAILASIAFGYEVEFDDVYVEGIESISINDIRRGEEMGYAIKLLGIAEKSDDGRLWLRVVPAFIADDELLAQVSGPFNAVSIFGSAVGNTMFYGRGAGMMPTASAVVADIIEVANGNSKRLFDTLISKPHEETKKVLADVKDSVSRYYIRLNALDKPGVFAAIADTLGKFNISISGALQHEGQAPENYVPVMITTHFTTQRKIENAIKAICGLNIVAEKPVCIQIVDIPEDNV